MDVPILEMDRYDARQRFHEYKALVEAERGTDEDLVLMKGYQRIAKGESVVSLHEVFRTSGQDRQGRPHLAIARATTERVYFRWYRWDAPVFADSRPAIRQERLTRQRVVLPQHTFEFPQAFMDSGKYTIDCDAIVPTVPAKLRPKASLANYHILWEAEWEHAPVDPLLLRFIAGDLYAIVAEWDLTPLERSILEGRSRRP